MKPSIRVRTAMLHGAGDLRFEETLFDPASLGPSQVFVRTEVTGFSTGTDLGNYEGRSLEVPGAPDYPRRVGYSNTGAVAMVGKSVTSLRSGDRVFSMKPHGSAYVAESQEMLVKIPSGVDADQASLAYLVHLGIAALRQVRYEAGENICVVGLGVIGLCTVAAARAMGAGVVAIANSENRTLLAKRLGASETYMTGSVHGTEIFAGNGADVVVLTANTWGAYEDSMEAVRRGGRVAVLGFPGRGQPAPRFNPVDARWLYGKQLTICGCGNLSRVECTPSKIRFNVRRNLEYIFDLMASGRLNLLPVISHRLPWDRMRDAYELAARHSKDFTAAIFDWRPANQ